MVHGFLHFVRAKMKHLKRHLFILSLLTVMAIGYFFASNLAWFASQPWLKWSIVVVTLFVMALPIKFSSLKRALSKPTAAVIACGVSYLFIPLLMWAMSRMAGPVLGPGLIMVAAVPTTLASGAVWTRRGGGGDSIAMLVTIITNSICFLVTPLLMFLISGLVIDRELLYVTIVNLLLFVVLPMGAAQLVRSRFKTVGDWSIKQKPKLSLLAQAGVLSMIFIGAIKTGLRFADGTSSITTTDILMTILIALVVHLVAFAVAIQLAAAAKLPQDQQIAVGVSGSQKTLMIGLSAATSLGVTIIPLVVYQVMQLTVDTFIVDWWRKRNN